MRKAMVKLRHADTSFTCRETGWTIRLDEQKETPAVHSQHITDAIRHGALIVIGGDTDPRSLMEGDPTSLTQSQVVALAQRINAIEKRNAIQIFRRGSDQHRTRDEIAADIVAWRRGAEPAPIEDKGSDTILSGMGAKEACEFVRGMHDLGALKVAAEVETRKTVLAVLNERIAELEMAG